MNSTRIPSILTACLMVACSTAVIAEDKLVVTAFGGIWQQSIEKNFASCYKDQTKNDISIQLGDPASWLSRIRANPGKPSIDVVTLASADTIKAMRAGMLEPLNVSKLPNLSNIPRTHYESFNGQAVNVHTGALGVLYNKQAVPNPPKDWRTLLDGIASGKYGKRVSLPAGTYTWGPDFIWFVGQVYGGNADVAFTKLKAMSPSVVKYWTEPAEAINLFGTKQVDILVYWDGRSHDFISKGNESWASYYNPGPKSLASSVAFAKVKNGSDAAWDFINCALSPKAQLAHANLLGYGVTNTTVTYPDTLKARITPQSDLVHPPHEMILDSAPQWIDRWNREMR